MAVVEVISALEERLGISIEDDDISGETFESLASLTAFIESKGQQADGEGGSDQDL